MPRARSPNWDKAFLICKSSKGKKKNKDIAAELGVSEKQLSNWRREDNWEELAAGGKSRKSTDTKSGKKNPRKKNVCSWLWSGRLKQMKNSPKDKSFFAYIG